MPWRNKASGSDSTPAPNAQQQKGPPAPTGDPLNFPPRPPRRDKQRVWTITEESPMILTVSGGATPGTADPMGVSCANPKPLRMAYGVRSGVRLSNLQAITAAALLGLGVVL